ncbi:hypothetical protein N7414_20070 [Pseudomonas sp. GD04087]|uniref:hypothetical protein n=1 Tax=unclassified Pseudomonas TaxID=196821 RepID=UPI00244693AC|nr:MULTISPECIES: hypothetical protein [unclassified Pseudomonas]MDH0291428.1 hypothetical protein [Pseudomonas sp. GD04087]MDH1051740.1 hypothetical protein [Pseudomonas sp. GD03903]MDH2001726.1 hypothetical protein [Pseudomonas sp. GD03691]
MGKPIGDLARQALDRARRTPPAPARIRALARPAQAERKAITERREKVEEGLPVRVAPAGQRVDQVLFRQGRIETAELLSTMLGMIEHRGAAAEVIARLRKGAESKPASYAAGVEALLEEVAAMVARHEMNNPQNVARESWR